MTSPEPLRAKHTGPAPVEAPPADERKPGSGSGGVHIRCPRCSWRHDFQPHWMCERCRTSFDTFRTHAVCPSCAHSWTHTWCPKCGLPSPHDAWYVSEGPPGGA